MGVFFYNIFFYLCYFFIIYIFFVLFYYMVLKAQNKLRTMLLIMWKLSVMKARLTRLDCRVKKALLIFPQVQASAESI